MFEHFSFPPETATTSSRLPEPPRTRTPPPTSLFFTFGSLNFEDDAPVYDETEIRTKRQSFARMQTDEAMVRAVRELAARISPVSPGRSNAGVGKRRGSGEGRRKAVSAASVTL